LCDRRTEGVKDTGVLTETGEAFESLVHFCGILLRELRDGLDSEDLEIAEHCRSDGDEVLETTFGAHGSTLLSLSVRYRGERYNKRPFQSRGISSRADPEKCGAEPHFAGFGRCVNVFRL